MDRRDDEPSSGPRGDTTVAAPSTSRLTVVISSLNIGGAARVLIELANHWVAHGWDVTIVHFSPPGSPPFFPLDPRVREVQLDLHGVSRTPISGIFNNIHRIRVLRRAIRSTDPDLILSLMNKTNVLTAFSTIGLRVPVIVAEHTAPRNTLSLPWHILREVSYRLTTFVVMLTPDALALLSAGLRRRGRVIPNPLPSQFLAPDVMASAAGPGGDAQGPIVMGLGRLTPEKGFDLLIEAFARIAARWPTARLEIWGDGDEREALQRDIARVGLADRIALPGETRVPERDLARATVFVLSSRLEGLPVALMEAMAVGRAVVACDCDHGPRDIVRDGVDGLLIPPGDVKAIADAIDGLLRDPERRASLGRRAVEVRDRFAIGPISTQWDALFAEARAGR